MNYPFMVLHNIQIVTVIMERMKNANAYGKTKDLTAVRSDVVVGI